MAATKIKNPPNCMTGSDGSKHATNSVAPMGYVQKATGAHGSSTPIMKARNVKDAAHPGRKTTPSIRGAKNSDRPQVHGAATAALGSAGARMTRTKPGRSPVAPVDKRGGMGR